MDMSFHFRVKWKNSHIIFKTFPKISIWKIWDLKCLYFGENITFSHASIARIKGSNSPPVMGRIWISKLKTNSPVGTDIERVKVQKPKHYVVYPRQPLFSMGRYQICQCWLMGLGEGWTEQAGDLNLQQLSDGIGGRFQTPAEKWGKWREISNSSR